MIPHRHSKRTGVQVKAQRRRYNCIQPVPCMWEREKEVELCPAERPFRGELSPSWSRFRLRESVGHITSRIANKKQTNQFEMFRYKTISNGSSTLRRLAFGQRKAERKREKVLDGFNGSRDMVTPSSGDREGN